LWQQGGKVKRLCREVCLVPRKLKEAPRLGAYFRSSGGFRLLSVESLGSSAYPR